MPVICDFEIIYEHGKQSPSVDEPHVEGVAALSAHGRRVANLEEAKVQFRQSWPTLLTWAGLSEVE